jgi:hypothetical protein
MQTNHAAVKAKGPGHPRGHVVPAPHGHRFVLGLHLAAEGGGGRASFAGTHRNGAHQFGTVVGVELLVGKVDHDAGD